MIETIISIFRWWAIICGVLLAISAIVYVAVVVGAALFAKK